MINQTLLTIVLIVSAVALGFLIYALVAIRNATVTFTTVVKDMERRMIPLLDEAEFTLRNLRRVSENVDVVTGTARELTAGFSDIAKNVRAVGCLIDGVRAELPLRVTGLKAGVKTALVYLLSHLRERR